MFFFPPPPWGLCMVKTANRSQITRSYEAIRVNFVITPVVCLQGKWNSSGFGKKKNEYILYLTVFELQRHYPDLNKDIPIHLFKFRFKKKKSHLVTPQQNFSRCLCHIHMKAKILENYFYRWGHTWHMPLVTQMKTTFWKGQDLQHRARTSKLLPIVWFCFWTTISYILGIYSLIRRREQSLLFPRYPDLLLHFE